MYVNFFFLITFSSSSSLFFFFLILNSNLSAINLLDPKDPGLRLHFFKDDGWFFVSG